MKKLTISIVAGYFCAACVATPDINLADYAPVIDTYKVDQAKYQTDIEQCRSLGVAAYAKYKTQRDKEKSARNKATIVGVLAGGAIGAAIGDSGGRERSTATVGALYGASIARTDVDITRTIQKFGPTKIIDQCMTDRGYKIISATGYGGG